MFDLSCPSLFSNLNIYLSIFGYFCLFLFLFIIFALCPTKKNCCVIAALQVILLDVDSASNAAVCDEITNKSQVAHAYTCDLSDKDAIYETAAKV